MRSMIAAALMLGTIGQAAAIECPITHALYQQEGGDWTMRFRPVPEDGAANQIAAFTLTMPGAPETVFDGGIYIPNGFGQTHGDIRRDPADSEPFWEGVVYALVDGRITEFPFDPERSRDVPMSPQQILLPLFASTVWYSGLRASEFTERAALDTATLETFTLDAFKLATCVK